MKKKTIILLFSLIAMLSNVTAQLQLPSFFTDNMVLQQQTVAPIWGKAKANQTVTVTSSWDKNKQKVTADSEGLWKVDLNTPLAGGPYTITVSTSRRNTIKLNNVLIGEVWLCSGQSNMEWRVSNDIKDMDKEIAAANYPQLRMIKIDNQTSISPQDDCAVEGDGWLVCSPETVGAFSAVGYFFGRDIHVSQNVPVGMINSSWGGSLAEVWIDGESLEKMPYFSDYIRNLRELPLDKDALEEVYQQEVQKWMERLNEKDGAIQNGRILWAEKDFNDQTWDEFKVPGIIQEEGFSSQNGLFWFRKEVNIPTDWEGKELTLKLGKLDDDDFTYFNGVLVGKTEGWLNTRTYKIPAKLVKSGKAVIAVRLIDTGGLGGFIGDLDDFVLESSKGQIKLAENWKAKFTASLAEIGSKPKRVNDDMNVPTALYNAMIHPFIQYPIKGAIWYQGESNADRAYQYRDLMPVLIQSWRKQFGYNFPFYMVQLANFMKVQDEPGESAWAELREAQLKSLHLNNTGMAVTIDVGEAFDIHPRNKQDVGYRLALNARANTYGEKIPYSGPIYKTHTIVGNTIRIQFGHTDGGLKTNDGKALKGFAIAGVDHKFYWAKAEIVGNEVIVSAPEVDLPVAVRYAWADNPVCNLYNGADLPASPFRTDDWRGITE